jgi:hypothetical protein
MNATIERDFELLAGVHFDDSFLMNQYEFTLAIEVNTESIVEQNVAMDRMKYMVYEAFENCVFVSNTETDVINKYTNAGIKVCTVPQEPYDQIISLIIMLKLNAVCEGKLNVTDIVFTSRLSDEVRFNESIEVAEATFGGAEWWNSSTTCITTKQKSKREKIVKLVNNEWNDLGLSWKDKKISAKEILFTGDHND